MASLLDEQDPSLNPLSDRFSASAWFDGLRARRLLPPKQLSVSFRDLGVRGVHDAAEYQRTVGNFPLWASRTLLRRSAPVNILKGVDGLVRSGEMLLVLGRPGSGCSTLLKTLAGDTHGITVSPDATLNYHGRCFSRLSCANRFLTSFALIQEFRRMFYTRSFAANVHTPPRMTCTSPS